jgi:dihydroflavonol-4-reductase
VVKDRTTFVTGGTSSIGRVLVREMAREGLPVRVLARRSSNRAGLELPGVEFVTGDVTDPADVRRGMEGCENVIHMAAVVGYQVPESEWWRVNRDGSRFVLEAACDLGVKSMVQVSTLSVLNPTQPGEQADELRPVDTGRYFNLYQKTKRAADDLAREFAGCGLNVKIVYPAFGYGCSHASSHASMAETTLLRMASGQPVAIFGSGHNEICLAYYKDTVRGILLAHEHGISGEGYILGGENLTFPQIWAVVAHVLGKRPPTRKIPMGLLHFLSDLRKRVTGKAIFPPEFFEMLDHNWNFSSAKAECSLGWKMTPFQQGLTETWAEYQAGGEASWSL